MKDTGWRRNTKTGGWFNINDINQNKPQRYTVVHKTKISEEVGENYGTLEEGIDYYKRFFDNPRAYELQDEKGNKVDINKYMNDKIRSKSKKENEKTYYHTSNHDFNEFDNEMPRKAILGGQYGYGHYFFDDKEISDGYGAYSKYQYQAKVNVKNWFKSNEKDFNGNIRKLGYNPGKDDVADFLSKKGYGGSIIEHTNANGKKWYEYVVYDGKNIKIINKKEQK